MAEQSSTLRTRPSLLIRIRDPRDAASWLDFVTVYGPLVYGHCRGRGLSHEDAEDLTQNVFTQVARAIRTFEYQPDLGRFRGWLGTVVRNEILRLYHKRTRALPTGCDPSGPTVEMLEARGEGTAWDEEFAYHLLQTALARSRPHFEADTWRAFELIWLENRPGNAVARQLGRTVDWVYVAKSRVLKHLRQQVEDLADDAALFGW